MLTVCGNDAGRPCIMYLGGRVVAVRNSNTGKVVVRV